MELLSLPGLAFVMLSMFWGLAFLAIRIAVTEGFLPIAFVSLRLAIAGGIMLLVFGVLVLSKTFRFKTTLPKYFKLKMCLMAFFNNTIPFVSVAVASTKVDSGVTSILDSGIPIFASLFAPLLLQNERITKARVFGITTGFLGVISVCLHKVVADHVETVYIPGYLLVTLACASYGFASVFGVRFLKGVPGLVAVTTQLCFSAVQCLLITGLFELKLSPIELYKLPIELLQMIQNSSTSAFFSLIYVAVFASCFAYGCYFYLLETIGAVKQSLVGYLLPFWGLTAGIIVQHEWEDKPLAYKLLEIVGTVLIIGGILIVNSDKKNKGKLVDEPLLINEV
ncbi:hypothetical protein P9112_002555 [Eukaryota sp. TZLM1-RC]